MINKLSIKQQHFNMAVLGLNKKIKKLKKQKTKLQKLQNLAQFSG